MAFSVNRIERVHIKSGSTIAPLYTPLCFMQCDGTLLLDSLGGCQGDVKLGLFLVIYIVSSHYALGFGIQNKTCFMDFLSKLFLQTL